MGAPISAWGEASRLDLKQVHGEYVYDRPSVFDFVKKTPGDIRDYFKDTFRRENTLAITIVVASTALLIWGDQYLVDKAKNLGDHLGISHTNYQKSLVTMRVPGSSKSLDIEGPFDSGSALYFIGDGWIDVGLATGFLTFGLVKSDNRALQTSSELAESILASGTVVQALKHVTGRESPFTTEVPGGVWRFFPNQVRYAHSVPEFDAFPSGHVAAAMAAVTVIADNYEEYQFIRPVGYSLIGVLSFQMMNNGVHWASDYPLAIVMGYSFGKIAVRKGRRPKGEQASLSFSPMYVENGFGGRASYQFD
jgi:hypothetical protein